MNAGEQADLWRGGGHAVALSPLGMDVLWLLRIVTQFLA
jgi:hypothetical protein